MKITYPAFLTITLLILNALNAQEISKQANFLLSDTAVKQGHVGICIYEPLTNKYWYNYNATKYFIPASNTKIFSLYAGMKYLGDSIPGLKYQVADNGEYVLYPTGDPSFLHPDFKKHPVFSFLKNISSAKTFIYNVWKENALGRGWAWDDYNDEYMPERSMIPIYGNVISFISKNNTFASAPYPYFEVKSVNGFYYHRKDKNFSIKRLVSKNVFELVPANEPYEEIGVPFVTDTTTVKSILVDTLHTQNIQFTVAFKTESYQKLKVVYSQPADSIFKPMMHRSDNFFAEQTLLMVSNEKLGYMNDEKIIDTILKTDLKDIPQKPKWVDGSGLSRYNLFTPQSFVYILNKMKNEFGWQRIKNIFPTGGIGTLSAYYKKDSGSIYAKTGTLSNNCALSGYLLTKKNKLLIFSIMVNNYPTAATPIRKAIERFLQEIREKY